MDDRREGYFWLALIFICAVTVLYVQRHNLAERYLEYANGVEQINEADHQCKALDAEIDATRQRVENLGSDPLEIEESIRHNKGYVRPGETVIRIQRNQSGSDAATGSH